MKRDHVVLTCLSPKQSSVAAVMAMRRLGFLLLLAAVLAACSGRSGTSEVQPLSPDDGIELTLFYDDVSLVMFNGNDQDATQTQRLHFVRGELGGNDDFDGEDIPGDVIGAGDCFRITQQGRSPQNPPQCGIVASEEFLPNPDTYFWRAGPIDAVTFDVRLDDTIIARCDTVRRGDIGECRFVYPTDS